jgi:hypothetical protein
MFQVSGGARINHVGLKIWSGGGQSEQRKSSDHQTEELQMWPLHINASNREARVRRGADEPRPASFSEYRKWDDGYCGRTIGFSAAVQHVFVLLPLVCDV